MSESLADTGTAANLELARQHIHGAVACDGTVAGDCWRRRQHALSARDYAVTVLLAPDATDIERRHAHYYLDDTAGIISGH